MEGVGKRCGKETHWCVRSRSVAAESISRFSPLSLILMRQLSLRSVVTVLLVLVAWTATNAQSSQEETRRQNEIARRVAVTIVLTNKLPQGTTGAAILRRHSVVPHDVILLAEPGADANQLSAALFTLAATREVMGDTASADATVRVPSSAGPQAWARRETPRAGRTLDRLRVASPREVAGVGTVRAYDVDLLPHMLRGKMSQEGPSKAK